MGCSALNETSRAALSSQGSEFIAEDGAEIFGDPEKGDDHKETVFCPWQGSCTQEFAATGTAGPKPEQVQVNPIPVWRREMRRTLPDLAEELLVIDSYWKRMNLWLLGSQPRTSGRSPFLEHVSITKWT